MTLPILFTLFTFVILSACSKQQEYLQPPKVDEFYTPPDDFRDYKVGDILKLRKTLAGLRSMYLPINIKNSWQLMVRSENTFGEASYMITTVMEPFNADPAKILSYQTFQDSADLDCSPSFSVQQGASRLDIGAQFDMTFILMALQNGYYVVSPDYEGPQSAFLAGRQAGKAILDSIRAVLRSGEITGISQDAEVAMWGYSGGAMATGFAAVLQPSYAPEIKERFIGVALGGFATNITEIIHAIDGGFYAGLIPAALHGLANEYTFLKPLMLEYVDPAQVERMEKAADQCLINVWVRYVGSNIFNGKGAMFKNGAEFLKLPQVVDVLKDNSIIYLNASYVPQIPIFIYHSSFDPIVPIKDVYTVYDNWCEWGADSLEFSEGWLGNHITDIALGAFAGWSWLEKRFEGVEPVVKGCHHHVMYSNIQYPGAIWKVLDYFKGYYNTLWYKPLGRGTKSTTTTNITSIAVEYISEIKKSMIAYYKQRSQTRKGFNLGSYILFELMAIDSIGTPLSQKKLETLEDTL
ncbi:hypothetical protein LELG_04890 [Lodderomyces elongisporus NRRL YB-4239]|uniref:Uncharacterized protein n=1 Tax=Lodderomyces elongisporus (strain ATCC 11503 / CBS 2605 / JCM 1781 / NBRC 1676 / NRRL YB-4239) TaxID=379508 RepID=A5E5K1_LODEL|nr:hypothetical protein LELG_04890 [Lodderomyces elongisporus NRRL YB-4239]